MHSLIPDPIWDKTFSNMNWKEFKGHYTIHIDGLMQQRRISSALAGFFCIKHEGTGYGKNG